MKSKVVGSIHVNYNALKRDIATIRGFAMNQAYSEYAIGIWRTCILWNKTGLSMDDLSEEYDGHANITDLGIQLPYINNLINTYFNIRYMISARIFEACNVGFILPHRDYLDLKKGFTRLHIPLVTNTACMNSEEDIVFHMRQGEVWYIDGNEIHSGVCFSKTSRLHLVLDFDPDTIIDELVTDSSILNPDLKAQFIIRQPIDNCVLESITSISNLINDINFMDIMGILGKLHFKWHVSSALMYDWLIEIMGRSSDKELLHRSIQMKSYFIGHD